MAETPTEVQARKLIRAGLEMLFRDPEHSRSYEDILACCEGELEQVFDGWLVDATADIQKEVAVSGAVAEAR